jgi:hypothetical protein
MRRCSTRGEVYEVRAAGRQATYRINAEVRVPALPPVSTAGIMCCPADEAIAG